MWVPRRALRKHRRPLGSWSPQRPSSRPSRQGSSKTKASCCCRDCVEPAGARVRLFESNHTRARGRCALPFHPRTPAARGRPLQPPSPARRPLGTRLALWRFVPLFARGTYPSYGTAHGGTAHRNSAYGLYVGTTLPEGDERALMEVLFEELPDLLIHLRSFAGCLTRLQRLSPLGLGGVTFGRSRS